jgi:polyphenol oxidase
VSSTDGRSAIGTVHWMRQVHGATVLTVDAGPARAWDSPSSAGPGPEPVFAGTGDGLVATVAPTGLAVLTADCGAVALGSPEGIFAAVHAGWRGLVAGVIAEAVAVMRRRGATEVHGALGPCIHAECYQFDERTLAEVVAVLGSEVRGRTVEDHPALDIPAAVSSALAASGVVEVPGVDRCTACAGGYFSHRRRADVGRQALLVWAGDHRVADSLDADRR